VPVRVLKRGARGCSVFAEDAKLDFAAVEAEAVDPTGAGDAFAAGFLLGGSLEQAARRGLEAAARCVATVGSMP
jgi:sugar/nucleoside kinase (ribokinase family)